MGWHAEPTMKQSWHNAGRRALMGDVYLVAGNGSVQLLDISKQMVTDSVLSNKFRHIFTICDELNTAQHEEAPWYAALERQWTMITFTGNKCPCSVGEVRSETSPAFNNMTSSKLLLLC